MNLEYSVFSFQFSVKPNLREREREILCKAYLHLTTSLSRALSKFFSLPLKPNKVFYREAGRASESHKAGIEKPWKGFCPLHPQPLNSI